MWARFKTLVLSNPRERLWIVYPTDEQGMKEHFSDLAEAVAKALEGNKAVTLDRERLKKASPLDRGASRDGENRLHSFWSLRGNRRAK